MVTAHSPAATLCSSVVSAPCGGRAKFLTTPRAHCSALAGPQWAISAPISEKLYTAELERMQILPLSFGSASESYVCTNFGSTRAALTKMRRARVEKPNHKFLGLFSEAGMRASRTFDCAGWKSFS